MRHIQWSDHCWLGAPLHAAMTRGTKSCVPPPATSRHLPPMPTIRPFAAVQFWLGLPLQVTPMTRAPSRGLLPCTSMQLPPTPTIWPFLTFHCSPARPTQGIIRTSVPSTGYPCQGRLAHWPLELLTIWLAQDASKTTSGVAAHR